MKFLLPLLLSFSGALSQSCSSTLTPSYPAPVTSDGWSARLVVQGLTKPRSILFDNSGGLLVVQQGAGIVHFDVQNSAGDCVDLVNKKYLVNSTDLNHGITLSNDGKTLYASSSEAVYSWSYDSATANVGSTNQTIITGMSNDDHTTRTLLMSKTAPNTLIVSRGSNANIDPEASSLSSGHSQIKAFDLSNMTTTSTPYNFGASGRLLGWGLRNSVGVAEEPLGGGIYSVENSADQVNRSGIDIHENNPGEEMNFHGYLNGSTENQGGNYGYPDCFAVWNTSIPNPGSLTTGSQFSFDQTDTVNDTFCASQRVPPRLTFEAHMAPLDIKFTSDGSTAFVSFHGSWDRSDPSGYKVSTIAFNEGSPVAKSDSQTAITDIFTNVDNSNCPDKCFRPVGLALNDVTDRVFMSSDETGEIYVLSKATNQTQPVTSSVSERQIMSSALWITLFSALALV